MEITKKNYLKNVKLKFTGIYGSGWNKLRAIQLNKNYDSRKNHINEFIDEVFYMEHWHDDLLKGDKVTAYFSLNFSGNPVEKPVLEIHHKLTKYKKIVK